MKSIRIVNLRALADTGEIPLKPITVLVGQNGSGKSTFLRTFPLLRQSVESRTTGPILWYGDFVDFGSFREALNERAKLQDMSIGVKFQIPKILLTRRELPLQDDGLAEAGVTVSFGETAGRDFTIAKHLLFTFDEYKMELEFDEDGRVTCFRVNGRDLSDQVTLLRAVHRSSLVPWLVEVEPRTQRSISVGRNRVLANVLLEHVKGLVHGRTGEDTLHRLVSRLVLAPPAEMLGIMKDIRMLDSWHDRVSQWTEHSPEFLEIRDLIVANSVQDLLSISDDALSTFARNVRYIAPVRATAERYYRVQNLAVDEIDFQGRNLAMFLKALSDSEQKRFADWTEKYFGFASRASASEGHISVRLRETGGKSEYNLADMGFGFSQVLPIVTQLWASTNRSTRTRIYSKYRFVDFASSNGPITLAIEQPELHLHPRFQARLVDSFVQITKEAQAAGIDLRLLIETHSEAMVNRFGIRVGKGDLSADDISLVLFEKRKPDADATLRSASYSKEGFLENWPFGFFEPAGS